MIDELEMHSTDRDGIDPTSLTMPTIGQSCKDHDELDSQFRKRG